MKIIFMILFIILNTALYAKETICLNDNSAFTFKANDVFKIDTHNADKLKLCTLFVVEGYDFDTSPVVVYPSMINTNEALKKIIEEDKRNFTSKSVTAFIEKKANFKNKNGLNFEVRQFNNGKEPNEYELVYYHKAKKSIFLVVLSARKKDSLIKYKKDFEVLVNQIEMLKRKKK